MPKEGYPVTLGPCPECEEMVYVTDSRMAKCHRCPFECLISEYDLLHQRTVARNAIREHNRAVREQGGEWEGCTRIQQWEQESVAAGAELLDAVRKPTTPRPKFRDDGWPTRADVLLLSPAELAIRAAIEAVEITGASIELTDAVILLGKARDLVADHVEGNGDSLIATQNRLAKEASKPAKI